MNFSSNIVSRLLLYSLYTSLGLKRHICYCDVTGTARTEHKCLGWWGGWGWVGRRTRNADSCLRQSENMKGRDKLGAISLHFLSYEDVEWIQVA